VEDTVVRNTIEHGSTRRRTIVFRRISICALLIALIAGSAVAQQQEAILQRVVVPGSGFDLLVATPKTLGGRTFDLRDTPDALIVYLNGGELALVFDDTEEMVKALDLLRRSIGAFHLDVPNREERAPIAIYAVPHKSGGTHGDIE
jgi:hypothetical protein